MNYDDLGLGVGSLIKILPITTDQGYMPHIPVLRAVICYYLGRGSTPEYYAFG